MRPKRAPGPCSDRRSHSPSCVARGARGGQDSLPSPSAARVQPPACARHARRVAFGEPSQGGMPAAPSAPRAGAAPLATRTPSQGKMAGGVAQPSTRLLPELWEDRPHASALCRPCPIAPPACDGKAPRRPAARSAPPCPVHVWPVSGAGVTSIPWIGPGRLSYAGNGQLVHNA